LEGYKITKSQSQDIVENFRQENLAPSCKKIQRISPGETGQLPELGTVIDWDIRNTIPSILSGQRQSSRLKMGKIGS